MKYFIIPVPMNGRTKYWGNAYTIITFCCTVEGMILQSVIVAVALTILGLARADSAVVLNPRNYAIDIILGERHDVQTLGRLGI